MPLVQVALREGRRAEQIREMIRLITVAVVESIGAAPETVRIVVTEVSPTHWANGDVTLAEKGLE